MKIQQLGRTFCRYDGVIPCIVTIDPEFIKEVVVKQFDNFTDTFDFNLKPEETTLDSARLVDIPFICLPKSNSHVTKLNNIYF